MEALLIAVVLELTAHLAVEGGRVALAYLWPTVRLWWSERARPALRRGRHRARRALRFGRIGPE